MSAKIQLSDKSVVALKADALLLLVDAESLSHPQLAQLDEENGGGLFSYLERIEFLAAPFSVAQIPLLRHPRFSKLVLVGRKDLARDDEGKQRELTQAELGAQKSADVESLAIGVRACFAEDTKSLVLGSPLEIDLHSFGLGAALGAYQFTRYYFDKKVLPTPAISIAWGKKVSASSKEVFAQALRVGEGVCLARDLINEPPNELYPKTFADMAKSVAKKRGLTAKILDHQGIIRAGMNLHDAVGKGSAFPPYFIHLTYKPKGKPSGKVAFVGKGLTFDSGGLCIKPMAGMADMKSDMSGGAAVLGLMDAVSALGLDVEVHGIIGAAENMPDAAAYRPSDVIRSLCGKGVEVINTDAEGRLVLADALTYASRLGPDFIVDAATLTGATVVSLSESYSAFFTDQEPLASAMTEAAQVAGESFWRMPLIEELRAQLDSSITDLKHVGTRWGGAITAALFLREFTEGVPWMHCDIPGPTFRDRASGMHPRGGTGHAVMTFLELVKLHSANKIVASAPAARSASKKKAKASPAASSKKAVSKKAPAKSAASKGPVKKVSSARPRKSPRKGQA